MFRYRKQPTETIQFFPEQQQKSWGLVAGAVIGGVSAASSASSQRSAARRANAAAQEAQIDPNEVIALARRTANDNVLNSLAMEQRFTPENAALRQGSIQQLLAGLGNDPTGDQAITALSQQLGQNTGMSPSVRSPLLDRAIAMASGDLAQGGQLPQDVRNEVSRRSIASAGGVGGGSLGLSRFITPRDLGLSSLALRDSRLNRATELGGMDTNVRNTDVQNTNQASQLRSQLATLLANLGTNQFNRNLSTASFGQTLQPPEAGLSPGDVASLFTQNASNASQAGMNAAALRAQTGRNTAEAFGGLGGLVSGVDWGSIFNRNGNTTPTYPGGFGGPAYGGAGYQGSP